MSPGPKIAPPEPDPFGLEARTVHLRQAAGELDSRAYELIAEIVANQSSRGVSSVGFHPVCGQIIHLNAILIDRALEFDEKAKEFALARRRIRKPASNPFSQARADHLLLFIAQRIDAAPSWIRSVPGGLRLWPTLDKQHVSGLIEVEKQWMGRRIELEYPNRRAFFELEIKSIEMEISSSPEHKATAQRSKGSTAPQRSWTQRDLDEAIREYKARRASTYRDLVDGVRTGKKGAKKQARALYGRNSVAKALGVKSAAMVSKSPVWQAIADELHLRAESGPRPTSMGNRMGIELAVEQQGLAASDPVVDQVIRRETIQLIKKSMVSNDAVATVEKLERGQISDDQARELVQVYVEQKRDARGKGSGRRP